MNKLLDVAILSYNRVDELRRALMSFEGFSSNDVRIVVYEDFSPNRHLIAELVNDIKDDFSIEIILNSSDTNLGYDLNLMRAFDTSSSYVMFLSDDDFIDINHLSEFLLTLESKRPSILISPFIKRSKLYRSGYTYGGTYSIDVLYDSILFSGLTFRSDLFDLDEFELSFLSKSIYSQVFLVCKYWSFDSLYFKFPLIIAGEDGENFFGISDSTNSLITLQDRKSPLSNLYYQEKLQRVVFRALSVFYPNLINKFILNYSFRLISQFFRIRLSTSFKFFVRSVLDLHKLNLRYSYFVYFFLVIISLLPKFFLKKIYNFLVSKYRVSGG